MNSIFLDKNSKHHKMLIIPELIYKCNPLKLLFIYMLICR